MIYGETWGKKVTEKWDVSKVERGVDASRGIYMISKEGDQYWWWYHGLCSVYEP